MLSLETTHRLSDNAIGVEPAIRRRYPGAMGSAEDRELDRPAEAEPGQLEPHDAAHEAQWAPPERSDQAPGEEVVQVNDAYVGGSPPPQDDSHRDDDQHPTGG